MAKTTDIPICYLLMRNDLASLGMGKACAQAHHNGVVFAGYMLSARHITKEYRALYRQWLRQAHQGYGTVLTLETSGKDMSSVVEMANLAKIPALVINDPDYPIVDGRVCHHIPLDTCAFVFGRKSEVSPLLSRFGLFPESNPAAR